jgi:hypothetical protein
MMSSLHLAYHILCRLELDFHLSNLLVVLTRSSIEYINMGIVNLFICSVQFLVTLSLSLTF